MVLKFSPQEGLQAILLRFSHLYCFINLVGHICSCFPKRTAVPCYVGGFGTDMVPPLRGPWFDYQLRSGHSNMSASGTKLTVQNPTIAAIQKAKVKSLVHMQLKCTGYLKNVTTVCKPSF